MYFPSIPNRQNFPRICQISANMETDVNSKGQNLLPQFISSGILRQTTFTNRYWWNKDRYNLRRGWLISITTGKITAHGGNPIFGYNDYMHSHRSEIYATLALFTFLNEYCNYYQITNGSVNKLYSNNEEIVMKLKAIIKNKHTYLHGYRMSEHEIVLALIPILPKFLQVRHIKSHQDKVKGNKNLTLPEQLNSIVDDLVDAYATAPKKCHIQSTPVAIYFNGYYIANDYHQKLRSITHFK